MSIKWSSDVKRNILKTINERCHFTIKRTENSHILSWQNDSVASGQMHIMDYV